MRFSKNASPSPLSAAFAANTETSSAKTNPPTSRTALHAGRRCNGKAAFMSGGGVAKSIHQDANRKAKTSAFLGVNRDANGECRINQQRENGRTAAFIPRPP